MKLEKTLVKDFTDEGENATLINTRAEPETAGDGQAGEIEVVLNY